MLEGQDWHKREGASASSLDELKRIAPFAIDESYLSFLLFSNGGEGPLTIDPFNLCLYPAEEIVEIERDGHFHEFFPGLFVIGGNGGGEGIAFDLRAGAPYHVVYFDMTNIDTTESIQLLSPTFRELLDKVGLIQS